ncbi:hypothetical protein KUTeg_018876 [Tegillarca granosa]|uniref:CDT1 Geminin-binding domain-containing protein n=1 Tax=Tegillarca granosa TaxID=220873 RepID=A0ABQ9EBC1_TEGGR|nr:hypothetical protein KUTeg_018876 [Tegillarca granosa]
MDKIFKSKQLTLKVIISICLILLRNPGEILKSHDRHPREISTTRTMAQAKGGKSKTPALDKTQKSIKDVLGNLQNDGKSSDDSASDTSEIPSLANENINEEVTSAWDEHDGPPLTPSKRQEISSDSSDDDLKQNKSRKRTRRGKAVNEEVQKTPEKTDVEENIKPRRARKRLQMRANVIASSESETSEESKSREKSSEKQETLKISETPAAISPLPDTPDNVRQQIKNVPKVPQSANVKAAMEKIKQLKSSKKEVKISSSDVKAQLAKCGKLEELKAQLSKMSETASKLKKPVPKLEKFDKIELIMKKTAPAYERFHSLATPAPPTLSLPYKYKLLAEMFRGMDTVVSMLHNRFEICTFSKLKAAVQEMTKRQEKGLPAFGNKVSGYQLTIEANLEENDNSNKKQDRRTYSATDLLDRRNTFHNKLINIVKTHHKKFLANLQRPLEIPDHKITRWHPLFKLDEVPDVEVAELPQPPVVMKYQSARDVLDSQRGKLLPRVEKALEAVAVKTEQNAPKPEVKVEPKSEDKDSSLQYKGIPSSLLEKIRAKEAKKMEAAMMRNPAEDKKTVMIGRLPEMMRILRSHFIQEKKPALIKENVVQKLCDKMTPEWLKMVEIKKGKYLKMDRNVDLQKLTDKINNELKSRR